jgi:cytochrome c-type biogenesis protein CcmH/NrfG
MVYSAAGLVFGFVLGMMVANARNPPGTAIPSSAPAVAPALTGGSSSTVSKGAAKAASDLDPSEVRALTSLATQEKENAGVRVELGNLMMDHDRCEEAVRWYREAIALAPKNPDVQVDMGACLVRLTRYPDALAAFDAALAIDPDHKKAVFNKGIALVESGRPKEAVALWEGLLKRHPDDPQLQVLRTQIDKLRAEGAPGRS